MSKATVKPSSSFLKKTKQKSELLVGNIKVKSCVGIKLRKSSTSAKSGTFSPQFKNRPVFAAIAPQVVTSSQTTTAETPIPTPLPTPIPTNIGILFDLASFNKSFSVNSDGLVYSSFGLSNNTLSGIRDGVYYRALCRAANRWAHFLSFKPEMVAIIRQSKPNWNGLELNKFLIDKTFSDDSNTIASCHTEILTTNTSINTGFQITLNDAETQNYTEYQLFHVLTHEFGHALGMGCPTVGDGSNELLPNIFTSRNVKYYESKQFPKAYAAYNSRYNGIFRRNTEKAVVGIVFDWIPLADSGHWAEKPVIYDFGLYAPDPSQVDPRYIVFRGIYNDIMAPTYQTAIDSYFISEITLGELCDIYTPINGAKIYNYQRNTENSEVESSSLTSEKDCIFFNGTFVDPPLNKEIKIIGEDEDKTWFKETIKHNCSDCKPIYLDACSECS